MQFCGSNFFSDSEFLNNQMFVPSVYDIPLFINKNFLKFNSDRKWRQRLKKLMSRYPHYYMVKGRKSKRKDPVVSECPSTKKRNVDRFVTDKENHLPPNRYNIKDGNLENIIHKQVGTKGPYACFTGQRDDTTLRGHLAPPKFKGSRTMFYDIPGSMELLNHPRNYFRLKIRHGSRSKLIPSSRFMLQDLTLCPRNPKEPGPAHFNIQNYCIKASTKTSKKLKEPSVFFPKSCVPQNDRFWLNQQLRPGPGRYNVTEISCPCPRGFPYTPDRSNQLDMVSFKSPKRMQSCCPQTIRNIRGHGHSYIFKSAVKRLLTPPTVIHKGRNSQQIQLEHDAKYIKMITDPVRNAISYPTIDFTRYKPSKIRYNSIERRMKRCKLRNNKRVAFMSGCPRFVINKQELLLAKSKTLLHVHQSPNIPVITPVIATPNTINMMNPFDRLQLLPARYAKSRPYVDKTDKMRNTFEPLPPPRILIQDIKTLDRKTIDRINAKLKIENYFKDQYQ